MIYIALAILAILSFYNLMALISIRKSIRETKDSIQSQVSWAKEELRNDISGVKTVMKVFAAGGRVTPDMVEDGKPFADISAADAVTFLKQNPETVVVDVRTSSEFQAGHIPGARLIPVDEIENRIAEIPREAQHVLVTCQGGGRSSAACQFLSEKGYTNLINIYDGMGAWPAQKEIGVTIRPAASGTGNA
jgi:rhodanese-related sulfurtransferase